MDGNVFEGGSPGPDRVVIGSIAKNFKSAVYCAVITHDGQKSNGFSECKDDTMNPKGKGDQVGKGRELVDRLDL